MRSLKGVSLLLKGTPSEIHGTWLEAQRGSTGSLRCLFITRGVRHFRKRVHQGKEDSAFLYWEQTITAPCNSTIHTIMCEITSSLPGLSPRGNSASIKCPNVIHFFISAVSYVQYIKKRLQNPHIYTMSHPVSVNRLTPVVSPVDGNRRCFLKHRNKVHLIRLLKTRGQNVVKKESRRKRGVWFRQAEPRHQMWTERVKIAPHDPQVTNFQLHHPITQFKIQHKDRPPWLPPQHWTSTDGIFSLFTPDTNSNKHTCDLGLLGRWWCGDDNNDDESMSLMYSSVWMFILLLLLHYIMQNITCILPLTTKTKCLLIITTVIITLIIIIVS